MNEDNGIKEEEIGMELPNTAEELIRMRYELTQEQVKADQQQDREHWRSLENQIHMINQKLNALSTKEPGE